MRNALTGHSNAKALTVTLRSPRTPAGGPLLEPKRDQHGWRQRVPILSERKGEITAKSCLSQRRPAGLSQVVQEVI